MKNFILPYIDNITIPIVIKIKNIFFDNNNSDHPKKDIILLGQGWFAKGFIEHIDKSKYTIINISRNKFVNTPMLLDNLKSNTNNNLNIIKFKKLIDKEIDETIIKIDLETEQIITNKNKYLWKNKYLVCGLGSNTDNGFSWNEKLDLLKKININSSICIVGAGPTGTELSFHLSDLYPRANITILDGLPNVYTYLSNSGKDHILKKLKERSIILHTNKMYSKDDTSFNHVIFATGSRANDLTSKWNITPQLNLKGYNNIFAGGDGISINLDIDNISKRQELPRNAQVAYQQGKYIAMRINNIDKKQDDFKFDNKGISIYTGLGYYYTELIINNNKYKLSIPEQLIKIYYNFFK